MESSQVGLRASASSTTPTPRPPLSSPCLASHLFVSYFDNECFGVGQAAPLEPQPHPPRRLPPEQQQRDPCHHPDHDVIAYNPPWTATVAAEPLRMQVREEQVGAGRALREEAGGLGGLGC